MKFVRVFNEISLSDVPIVGGKNASLGQMIQQLAPQGIKIPQGFAVTADAYWEFLKYNKIEDEIKASLNELVDYGDIDHLQHVGAEVRKIIKGGKMPPEVAEDIIKAYLHLSKTYNSRACDVAVRSSATAEDLPGASFAGQQETFLNVSGNDDLIESCKRCMASLFTNRAIVYRQEKGFNHFKVALSVCVQKMVRSDLSSAGVMFTLDTRTGFDKIILIESSYGLGESVVKGEVVPDEFRVYKPMLEKGFKPIIKKFCGVKARKIIYSEQGNTISIVPVEKEDQRSFSLSDEEVLSLAKMGQTIDKYYSKLNKKWTPMDIEWAKDGIDDELYIVQARPETVHAIAKKQQAIQSYKISIPNEEREKLIIAKGQSIGDAVASGRARIVKDVSQANTVEDGDIIVTQMTTPDWVPVMRKAAGIITEKGGRTCHAAIVSRELGIPAIVGAKDIFDAVSSGQELTIDCSQGNSGFIYNKVVPFEIKKVNTDSLPKAPVKVMVNISDPISAYANSLLPVEGVGLARLEFIITNFVMVHPMALIHPEKIEDKKILKDIEELVAPYSDGETFFVNLLAQGIATIAAMFNPRPVMVRFSDFKSNEYRNLVGGVYFEQEEENPMIGVRGASRYYSDCYKDAFLLECKAMKKVRDEMGFSNVACIVPFIRTINEAKTILKLMKQQGLDRGENGLEIIMMAEIPSNAIMIEEFCSLFDGVSIGSNDLTQLTLGVDRDSSRVASIFDERDEAVKRMLSIIIKGCLKSKKYVGICGQAPSDYPEIAQFLVDEKVSSLSLNSDSVIPFLLRFKKKK